MRVLRVVIVSAMERVDRELDGRRDRMTFDPMHTMTACVFISLALCLDK